MTEQEIRQHIHYRPAKETEECGFFAKVTKEANPTIRRPGWKIRASTNIAKVDCPDCRKAIKRIVDNWFYVTGQLR